MSRDRKKAKRFRFCSYFCKQACEDVIYRRAAYRVCHENKETLIGGGASLPCAGLLTVSLNDPRTVNAGIYWGHAATPLTHTRWHFNASALSWKQFYLYHYTRQTDAFTCVTASFKLMVLPLRRKPEESALRTNPRNPQRESTVRSVFVTYSVRACVNETHSLCLMNTHVSRRLPAFPPSSPSAAASLSLSPPPTVF